MSISSITETQCTGCGACSFVCPFGAVEKKTNDEGFAYFVVNSNKCKGCGLCEKKCPVLTENGQLLGEVLSNNKNVSAFCVQNSNEHIRFKSASGGVFPMIAKRIIEMGGVVFGAGFDTNWKVCHFEIDKCEDIAKLQSSKYVQSDMDGVYTKIVDNLSKGKTVLFSGTPCQVAAVNNIVAAKLKKNLILIDLFCHGISSPGLFDAYLNEVIPRVPILSICFRYKKKSWEKYCMYIEYGEGESYSAGFRVDPYLSAFCAKMSLRNSCYSCKSKGFPRHSDLTLGDFWMIDRIFPDMNDHKGTSIVLAHTDKGHRIISELQNAARIKQIDNKNLIEFYSNSGKPVMRPNNRDAFFKEVKCNGIKYASKKYCKLSLKQRVVIETRKMLIQLKLYDFVRKLKIRG